VVELNIPEEELDRAAEEVTEEAMGEVTEEDLALIRRPISTDKLVSTGSTLLNLAISGGRVTGGGLPGGIIIEIAGPPSVGKTSLAAEIASSVQIRGGEVKFDDPEGRLDKEYAITYGVDIKKNFDYSRSDTVTEMFDRIANWKFKNPDVINAYIPDSITALSTRMEMEEGDKRGQRKAKEMSEGFRKTARIIANNGILLVCTNQIRQGDFGYTIPGGWALPFYSTIRMMVRQEDELERTRELKLGGSDRKVKHTAMYGIRSKVKITKNHIDNAYREVPLYIVWGHGIDDIQANLQWLKTTTGDTMYDAIVRRYQRMADAIAMVEAEGVERELEKKVTQVWYELQEAMTYKRKPKVRR